MRLLVLSLVVLFNLIVTSLCGKSAEAEPPDFIQGHESVDDTDEHYITTEDGQVFEDNDDDSNDNDEEYNEPPDTVAPLTISSVPGGTWLVIFAGVVYLLWEQSRSQESITTKISQYESEIQEAERKNTQMKHELSCMEAELWQSELKCLALQKELEQSKLKQETLTSLLNESEETTTTLREELNTQERSATKLREKENQLQTQLEQMKSQLTVDESDLKTMKHDYSCLQSNIASVTWEKALLEEKLKHEDELAKKAQEAIKELEQKLKVAEERLEKEEEVKRSIDKNYRDIIEKEQEKVKKLIENCEETDKNIQQLTATVTEITSSKLVVEDQLSASEKEKEQVKKELEKDREELKTLKTNLQNSQEKNTEFALVIERTNIEKDDLGNKLATAKTEKSLYSKKLQILERENDELKRKNSEITKEKARIQNLLESAEKSKRSVQTRINFMSKYSKALKEELGTYKRLQQDKNDQDQDRAQKVILKSNNVTVTPGRKTSIALAISPGMSMLKSRTDFKSFNGTTKKTRRVWQKTKGYKNSFLKIQPSISSEQITTKSGQQASGSVVENSNKILPSTPSSSGSLNIVGKENVNFIPDKNDSTLVLFESKNRRACDDSRLLRSPDFQLSGVDVHSKSCMLITEISHDKLCTINMAIQQYFDGRHSVTDEGSKSKINPVNALNVICETSHKNIDGDIIRQIGTNYTDKQNMHSIGSKTKLLQNFEEENLRNKLKSHKTLKCKSMMLIKANKTERIMPDSQVHVNCSSNSWVQEMDNLNDDTLTQMLQTDYSCEGTSQEMNSHTESNLAFSGMEPHDFKLLKFDDKEIFSTTNFLNEDINVSTGNRENQCSILSFAFEKKSKTPKRLLSTISYRTFEMQTDQSGTDTSYETATSSEGCHETENKSETVWSWKPQAKAHGSIPIICTAFGRSTTENCSVYYQHGLRKLNESNTNTSQDVPICMTLGNSLKQPRNARKNKQKNRKSKKIRTKSGSPPKQKSKKGNLPNSSKDTEHLCRTTNNDICSNNTNESCYIEKVKTFLVNKQIDTEGLRLVHATSNRNDRDSYVSPYNHISVNSKCLRNFLSAIELQHFRDRSLEPSLRQSHSCKVIPLFLRSQIGESILGITINNLKRKIERETTEVKMVTSCFRNKNISNWRLNAVQEDRFALDDPNVKPDYLNEVLTTKVTTDSKSKTRLAGRSSTELSLASNPVRDCVPKTAIPNSLTSLNNYIKSEESKQKEDNSIKETQTSNICTVPSLSDNNRNVISSSLRNPLIVRKPLSNFFVSQFKRTPYAYSLLPHPSNFFQTN